MFGIKSSEIAFIHEAKTENQRQRLFDKVNNGEIRILIGSTFKLGLGVNVQKKLIAIHHLDVPWRPADMIQREGRIIRQGNENKEVFIYRYIQEASFDAYSWQLLETKQKFIDELLANSISVRSVLDVSDIVLNYGEVKALAIGNMRLRERFEIYNELNRLRLLHNNDQQLRSRYERELLEIPKKMEELEQLINDYTFDYAIYCSSRREYSGEERNEIRNYIYDEVLNNVMMKEERSLLSYQGFELILPMNMTEPKPYIWAVATHKHKIEMSNSASGCLIRIDNYLDNLNKKKKELEFEITLLKEKESSIKVTLERQIDYEPMIAELKMKLEKIDKELNG
jgi:superfamily II DNA/RNA helicase